MGSLLHLQCFKMPKRFTPSFDLVHLLMFSNKGCVLCSSASDDSHCSSALIFLFYVLWTVMSLVHFPSLVHFLSLVLFLPLVYFLSLVQFLSFIHWKVLHSHLKWTAPGFTYKMHIFRGNRVRFLWPPPLLRWAFPPAFTQMNTGLFKVDQMVGVKAQRRI